MQTEKIVVVPIPKEIVEWIDGHRGVLSRSKFIQMCVERCLNGSSLPKTSAPIPPPAQHIIQSPSSFHQIKRAKQIQKKAISNFATIPAWLIVAILIISSCALAIGYYDFSKGASTTYATGTSSIKSPGYVTCSGFSISGRLFETGSTEIPNAIRVKCESDMCEITTKLVNSAQLKEYFDSISILITDNNTGATVAFISFDQLTDSWVIDRTSDEYDVKIFYTVDGKYANEIPIILGFDITSL